ncbi:MAG: AmmeMemoRadiSam system protein B [Prevotella sp.]|nr:AmmeMemoRadiSam system protein B [Prevotella sp.]
MKSNGQTPQPVVKPASQAGRFYEGDPQRLCQEVDSFLALHAGKQKLSHVAALIVPHAGYYFSGRVAASAYASLSRQSQYKRIFLLGPSHYEWLDGASVDDEHDSYATPLGLVKVDRETALKLQEEDSVFFYTPKAHDREHCLEVQLPFLQRCLDEVPPIVPIIISTDDFSKLERMAKVLKPYLNEENLFIISSDFSHYPSYEDAYKVDSLTGKAVESCDINQFLATLEKNANLGIPKLSTSACGELGIATLMLMTDKRYQMKHLMYQNSGDADSHDRSRVVGYHAFALVKNADSAMFELTDQEKTLLKTIAYESIEGSLNGKSIKPIPQLADYPVLSKKCGAFVTLHRDGKLRGCIGHFGEDVPLHKIVALMARAAAFEDPRFRPVRSDELSSLDIEISVLTPMRRIQSLDEFELHRHGIFIKKGSRSGTYLPHVADEVNWTKEEFVSSCSHDKAGLGWDGWRDAELYVYEAIVF